MDAPIERLVVRIGGLSRERLRADLHAHGVRLNEHADTLLAGSAFDGRAARSITVSECAVADLGLPDGAPLSRIFEAARLQVFSLCPADTAPYLRLAVRERVGSTGSLRSTGRAPDGALTVASDLISDNDAYPKGFYLRSVGDEPWLRGYRCDEEHIWSPEDRFVFRVVD
ncbi:hypothetical protein [Agromyces mangrovi Wang et al. 2018]|uniref:hypothetical protein n=1 Tax=Agromyces mangrovi TaxID=1858653 RepID=UPI0025744634|nr:hypothetical protein [Agromyces mangrovi]BDZ64609.1 hypothetical protein GCM10025877_15470 [Agromyces mangrovi]